VLEAARLRKNNPYKKERMIDTVMHDFHEHKIFAHPIAAGEVAIKV